MKMKYSDTQKVKEFTTSISGVQEMSKEILHKEEMISYGNIDLCKEMKTMGNAKYVNITVILGLKKLLNNNIQLIMCYTEDNFPIE